MRVLQQGYLGQLLQIARQLFNGKVCNFNSRIRKVNEKNGGGVTETTNRYSERVRMPVNIPIWTNRLIRRGTERKQGRPDNGKG